ncbi:MAG: hypothetical protein HGB28_01360 [Oscillochloris sp.]|nr:hypothetical protein [Oscillochloris sp.]
MATTPHDSTTDRALALRDWLVGLQLPPRAINSLSRDLEVVLGQREGAAGKGGLLAGVDQEQFIAELYQDEGGMIRRIPSVGALTIEALREAIPRRREEPTPPSAEEEGWRDFGLDDFAPHPVEQEAASADDSADDATASAPPPLRRRGRPRRADRAAPSAPLADEGDQPKKRRGRPRRIAEASVAPAAAPAEASAPPAPESDAAQIQQIWQQLHPQGRRAVLSYIAEQLVAPQV